MSKKSNIITVHLDGVDYLIPAKERAMLKRPEVLPVCLWCQDTDVYPIIGYTQLGFESDRVTEIAGCHACNNASVYTYYMDKD